MRDKEMHMKSRDSNQITREYFESLLVEMRHIDAVLPSKKTTKNAK